MIIPTLDKGQPVDSAFLSKIVDAINDMYSKISAKFSNSQVSTKTSGKQIARTTDLMFDAGFETISNSTQSTTSEIQQTHSFGSTFRYPPIVVATPVIDNTISGKTILVYVKNITTTSVDIVVKFGTADTTAVDVNILATGLPSVS